MEHSASICPEDLAAYRSSYEQNTISRLTTRAVSKASVSDICYDARQARRMNHKFSVDIPTMAATNQFQTGRCWIFAALNILRETVSKKLNLESFELSQSFFSFYDHLEKSNCFLEHIIETAGAPLEDRYVHGLLMAPVGDGGWWEFFVGLCLKYGAVPKECMPENRQTENSQAMNTLLNSQLRKDALLLRKAAAAGTEPEALRVMKKKMLAQVYNLLAICLGDPPETFDFEYVDKDGAYHADRNLTPHSFYDAYIGVDLTRFVTILNAPCAGLPFYRTYLTDREENIRSGYPAKRLNLPMEAFKAAVIRQLQAGELVWFVCDSDYDISMAEGIWDTATFDYETPFGLDLAMEKGDMLDYRQSDLDHAMVLTGVNLVDGKPDKWKVQNSWGTEKANKGYFILSDDWFDRYVYTATIARDYLTEEQCRLFDQEPVILPPWNVMT